MTPSCPLCSQLVADLAAHVCALDPTAAAPVGPKQQRISAELSRAAAPSLSTKDLPPRDKLIGTTIGDRYEIQRTIGRGGMGTVFEAQHIVLKTSVAVKVLLRPGGDIAKRRFLLEAQLASKIRHPHIVYIADFGILPDGRSYLVMEYLRGQTLAEVLESTRLGVSRAVRIARQLASGMQAVHDQGIVHRDLKPSNIFLLEDKDGIAGQKDFVKVVDFGIAKDADGVLLRESAVYVKASAVAQLSAASGGAAMPLLGTEPTAADLGEQPATADGSLGTPGSPEDASLGLTRQDVAIGTPQYMAPE